MQPREILNLHTTAGPKEEKPGERIVELQQESITHQMEGASSTTRHNLFTALEPMLDAPLVSPSKRDRAHLEYYYHMPFPPQDIVEKKKTNTHFFFSDEDIKQSRKNEMTRFNAHAQSKYDAISRDITRAELYKLMNLYQKALASKSQKQIDNVEQAIDQLIFTNLHLVSAYAEIVENSLAAGTLHDSMVKKVEALSDKIKKKIDLLQLCMDYYYSLSEEKEASSDQKEIENNICDLVTKNPWLYKTCNEQIYLLGVLIDEHANSRRMNDKLDQLRSKIDAEHQTNRPRK